MKLADLVAAVQPDPANDEYVIAKFTSGIWVVIVRTHVESSTRQHAALIDVETSDVEIDVAVLAAARAIEAASARR